MHQQIKRSNQPTAGTQRKHAHSIQADLVTGWRPKMKIIGPIPLNFDNLSIDHLLKPLINSDTSLIEVIYLGLRPRDTFQMHEFLAKHYHYKYQHLLFSDAHYLKAFFRKFYSEFEPQIIRPYHGMNPHIKSNIVFQSRFQSGNLDAVIRTKANQYDLILRIDSNTNGHIMWYYFQVVNTNDTPKKIRLNIINLRRQKNFYENSLKPYIKRIGREWQQGGENIVIKEDYIQFSKQSRVLASFLDNDQINDGQLYRKLSFDLQLDSCEEVSVAYSIPYTYSNLLNDLRHFKKLAYDHDIFLDVCKKSVSLSGLEIPHLTIMDKQVDTKKEKKKYCIFIIGRQHPGQSNSSHVLKGFIQGLLSENSEDMKILRRQCVFHIIPMLNPDGVVMGNFRTSLYGKDLNRLFKKNKTLMIPEMEICRDLMFELSKRHGNKLFMFIDFHGHSVRRNAFFFAPSFLDTQSNEDIRQFPKHISSNTEIFRYQSCSFRISTLKKTTARAVFSKLAGLCYTLETSNWSFFSKQQNKIVLFTQSLWNQLGSKISISLGEFISSIVFREEKRKEKRSAKKNIEMCKFKKLYLKTKQDEVETYRNNSVIKKDRSSISPVKAHSSNFINSMHTNGSKSDNRNHQNQKQLLPDEEQPNNNTVRDNDEGENKDKDEGEDSDDSDQQDMESGKFKQYINVASKMLIEFQKAYYGDQYDEKKRVKVASMPKKKPQKKQIQQACFRYQDRKQYKISQKIEVRQKTEIRQKSESVSKIDGRYSLNNRSIGTLENRLKRKLDNSISRGYPNINEEEDPKKQILQSLPRISLINCLALQQPRQQKQASKHRAIFKIPKIQPQIKGWKK